MTWLPLTIKFVSKCLKINRETYEDQECFMALIALIIAIFENMHRPLSHDLPQILRILVDELDLVSKQKKVTEHTRPTKSILLQAISMAFTYNSQQAFQWLAI